MLGWWGGGGAERGGGADTERGVNDGSFRGGVVVGSNTGRRRCRDWGGGEGWQVPGRGGGGRRPLVDSRWWTANPADSVRTPARAGVHGGGHTPRAPSAPLALCTNGRRGEEEWWPCGRPQCLVRKTTTRGGGGVGAARHNVSAAVGLGACAVVLGRACATTRRRGAGRRLRQRLRRRWRRRWRAAPPRRHGGACHTARVAAGATAARVVAAGRPGSVKRGGRRGGGVSWGGGENGRAGPAGGGAVWGGGWGRLGAAGAPIAGKASAHPLLHL